MIDSTYSTNGPECPYCGHTQRPDDPGFYADHYDSDECPKCEKSYSVSVFHSTSWACEPIEEAPTPIPQHRQPEPVSDPYKLPDTTQEKK